MASKDLGVSHANVHIRWYLPGYWKGDRLPVYNARSSIVMGDEVIIDGVTGKVTGIESHCVDWGKDPGQPVGILLGP